MCVIVLVFVYKVLHRRLPRGVQHVWSRKRDSYGRHNWCTRLAHSQDSPSPRFPSRRSVRAKLRADKAAQKESARRLRVYGVETEMETKQPFQQDHERAAGVVPARTGRSKPRNINKHKPHKYCWTDYMVQLLAQQADSATDQTQGTTVIGKRPPSTPLSLGACLRCCFTFKGIRNNDFVNI